MGIGGGLNIFWGAEIPTKFWFWVRTQRKPPKQRRVFPPCGTLKILGKSRDFSLTFSTLQPENITYINVCFQNSFHPEKPRSSYINTFSESIP